MYKGNQLHLFAQELWPINRSLTGVGVRQTLRLIKTKLSDLSLFEVPSGSQAFDWVVPKEWLVRDAYIKNPKGEIICNFKINNLHLMGYSIPINQQMLLSDLQEHLYSLPDQPNAIPYVTSYYQENWGFCLSEIERSKLVDGIYEVFIDSDLFEGSLTYGELIIPGETQEEIFFSTYICHPSMANNEISGPVVTTFLAQELLKMEKRRYTYRLVFIPETIGSLVYLSKNLDILKRNVKAGYNITCIGDDRCYSFLPSRNGATLSDKVALHVLGQADPNFLKYNWLDRGSDERQYCSPGVDLPIASIMRSKYGEYPEYHTSLDDLVTVVTPEGLEGGLTVLLLAVKVLEDNYYPRATVVGEPQLGKRGLYPNISTKKSYEQVRNLIDAISFADGKKSILEIAEILGISFFKLKEIYDTLVEKKLINYENEVLP